MRIGVLETGAPPAELQPSYGDYPAMFRALLGEGFRWTTYDVQAGRFPARPEDEEALIVTGAAAGVYDGDPWIGRLMEFLRAARGRTRLVGVCFGHQVMAEAFGGKVIKSPKGWGVGLHTYEVLDAEPWMDAAGAISIPASHQDQVVELPPGARVLAASAFTPYGMLDHLVLVGRGNRDGPRRVHPGLGVQHLIGVQANAPALGGLDHLAAEGLGHGLVAEADPHQPGAAPRGPEEFHEPFYPEVAVIDPRRRAGDDQRVFVLRPGRKAARLDVVAGPAEALAQQRPEH